MYPCPRLQLQRTSGPCLHVPAMLESSRETEPSKLKLEVRRYMSLVKIMGKSPGLALSRFR